MGLNPDRAFALGRQRTNGWRLVCAQTYGEASALIRDTAAKLLLQMRDGIPMVDELAAVNRLLSGISWLMNAPIATVALEGLKFGEGL